MPQFTYGEDNGIRFRELLRIKSVDAKYLESRLALTFYISRQNIRKAENQSNKYMFLAPLNFLACSQWWNPLTESRYLGTCQSSQKSLGSGKTKIPLKDKNKGSTDFCPRGSRDLSGQYQVDMVIFPFLKTNKRKKPKLPHRIIWERLLQLHILLQCPYLYHFTY